MLKDAQDIHGVCNVAIALIISCFIPIPLLDETGFRRLHEIFATGAVFAYIFMKTHFSSTFSKQA
jgi:hypothetical protein